MKRLLMVVIGIVLVGAAFFGGTLYAKSTASAAGPAVDGRAGGPMANLSTEDRAAFQNMSDEERQAFMEKQGMTVPTDGAIGARGARGGLIEGEVIDVASDSLVIKLTSGGSQTVYIDADTVTGYTESTGKLAAGSTVLVFSESTADNVVTATAILVK
ncbi:MAG: hypothetical protein CVT66_10375 [Actinobacteria bacterium HGW-Actinobacteria-6]|jgi:uncharacterized membrane protein|nr:MAG: hypothetical protein CVT66_10375 [Actinobacteria bacterium HGW-Actinobacteria-6]